MHALGRSIRTFYGRSLTKIEGKNTRDVAAKKCDQSVSMTGIPQRHARGQVAQFIIDAITSDSTRAHRIAKIPVHPRGMMNRENGLKRTQSPHSSV
ncbi:hypothetical protein CEXT_736201 [Caerostris extrusa]|uniref:Uncharacterized protein n=1 Tax=Caerostris extrusa TaxID=172846 RepID=A0AAV4MNL9_CAEEX|nr:hypothetical protein CEXT_736201 [Caerostris extrusa]